MERDWDNHKTLDFNNLESKLEQDFFAGVLPEDMLEKRDNDELNRENARLSLINKQNLDGAIVRDGFDNWKPRRRTLFL